jgi:ferrous iron transport protein B
MSLVMSVSVEKRAATVALIGNPNTGKSTLFNALCGMRQRVGNYPGVTVEKKLGRCEIHGRPFQIIDLPGSYSLAPRSPDEMVAVEVLLGLRDDVAPIDAVVCIVDASNLERNLYLVNQVLELNLPVVIALNMVDIAADKGLEIDVAALRTRLGIPVIEVQANRKRGLADLRQAISTVVNDVPKPRPSPFPAEFQLKVAELEEIAAAENHSLPRYLVERLLLDTSGFLSEGGLSGITPRLRSAVHESREHLASAGCPVPAVEAMARYQWVGEITTGVVRRAESRPMSFTDRLDRLLTHRVWGTVVFLAVMLLMFESVFYFGEYASAGIAFLKSGLSDFVSQRMAEGALRSLVVDGVIEGVGGVVTFLPQIFVLFLFIAILEDCGYMARAAYLMDKVMSRVGLSGKSFIPLLSSFACAIPGIMSARVIENPRDRLLTILIAPLMSCSARFPVYTLMIQAFIPDVYWQKGLPGLRAVVLFAMYLLGIVTAVAVALLLRRTILRGPAPPFVMELPTYKMPGFFLVAHRMWEAGWSFVRRAGTLILAVSVVVWAAAYYPRHSGDLPPKLLSQKADLETRLGSEGLQPNLKERLDAELSVVDAKIEGEHLRNSYLGRAGVWVEPIVRPLGWDWRLGCAAIASFPAREVVVATLGVLFNLGRDQDEESQALQDTVRSATWDGTDRPLFNIPVALSLMVFFALCAQCVSTLVVMRRETNSWRWPTFAFVYMTALAYFAAMLTYQIGMRL